MRWYWFLVSCLLIGIIAAATFWFSPSGTGEYQNSPNGKFTANALNMSRGTLFNGRIRYIELLVVELVAQREIWRAEFRHEGELKVPDYGDRSQKPLINWAPDSSSVTLPVGLKRQVTLPVQ